MPVSSMEVLFSGTIDRCLQKPFSRIATKNGKLVECVLNSVWNRSDPIDDADFQMGEFPENVELFVNFLNSMHLTFWDLAPNGVDAVIHR
ncbi:unnamed protein product [Caenorhabditis sp. 36 PRJEB53466]|nr:unnamed protein product [Caenorhabditis sp. 36 PRJEB53466]